VDRALPSDVRRQARLRTAARIAVPLLLVAGLIAWLPGWIRPSVSRSRVRTATVTTGPIIEVFTASGTVVPEVERVLSSPLDARVLRILKRPGTPLKKGDPVVSLDVSESVLTYEKALKDLRVKENQQQQTRLGLEKSLVDLDGKIEVKRLSVDALAAKLEGQQSLFKDGLSSQDALRQAELAVRQARIELAQLQQERANVKRSNDVQVQGLLLERASLAKEANEARRVLALATTESDRDGVLTWVLSQEGALVRRGDVIARIADLSSFRVDASVSDVHAERLSPGMAAIVKVNDQDLWGTVAEVFPTVENGVLRFTVSLAERAHPQLRPSLRVDVHVMTDRKPQALKVQRGPFVEGTGRQQAFVVRGARAIRTPIVVGLTSFDEIEVASGLQRGDEIIISDMRDYLHLPEIRVR
jgi:HlyD family secretion protein